MHKNHTKNILFVKSLMDEQPIEKRIEIYHWLAELAGEEWTTAQLHMLAHELEKVVQVTSAATKHSLELDLALASKNFPHDGDGSQDGHAKGDGK